ncbi:MAG: right-handed parallel beta-helix repeat-containing protein [Phycisphaerales bacterium]
MAGRSCGLMGLLAVVAVLCNGVPAFGQTIVGGAIGADTTWTLAGSPYLATDDVELRNDAVLTIEPGVEVAFRPGTALDARQGVLIADGAGGDTIVLRSAANTMGDWQGVLTSANAPSIITPEGEYVGGPIFRNVRITGADVAVRADDQPLYFESVTIERNDSRGIQFTGSTADATTWLKGVTIRDSGIGLSSFSDAGRFVLRDCVFEDNPANGVLLRDGSGELVRCVFRRNGFADAAFGGGGAFLRGSWQVRECVFEENGAIFTILSGGGGGLRLEGSESTVADCEFISNTASGPGGGAEIRPFSFDARVTIENCRFIANTSETSSGAGLLAGANSGSQLVIDIRGCTFEDNQGDSNGGLAVGNATGHVVDNVFRNNTGRTSGGAMRIFNEVRGLIIADNEFTNNATQAGGGAIDLTQLFRGTALSIEGNSFRDNSADRGGAIAGVGRVELSASGNAFEGNTARLGGAIEIRPDAADVVLALAGPPSNRFAANLAGLGAAIYNDSALAIDATGNCWGTSDPAAIAERIYDASDDPTRGVVAFDPIAADCDACPADLDGDGRLTLFDFLAFQTHFDAGDAAADFDGDGRLTFFDFLAFQTAFDAGCG